MFTHTKMPEQQRVISDNTRCLWELFLETSWFLFPLKVAISETRLYTWLFFKNCPYGAFLWTFCINLALLIIDTLKLLQQTSQCACPTPIKPVFLSEKQSWWLINQSPHLPLCPRSCFRVKAGQRASKRCQWDSHWNVRHEGEWHQNWK